jgi:hypothetical protein
MPTDRRLTRRIRTATVPSLDDEPALTPRDRRHILEVRVCFEDLPHAFRIAAPCTYPQRVPVRADLA